VSGRATFVPERGDVVKMNFDPRSGHEQSGWRPAVVVSPGAYNRASRVGLFCPITSRAKGYPFEVRLSEDAGVAGVILVDQIRCLDWRARNAKLVGRASDSVVREILARLEPLVT